MSVTLPSTKPFEPGTTGWTVADLEDPEFERLWFEGRFEIVEGVLTTMPPAYFTGGNGLFNLMHLVKSHLEKIQLRGRFSTEVDIVVDEDRVARADCVMLSVDDERLQLEASERDRRPDPQRTRILIPPTLVIESISPGHERHDERTKRRWYAEFGVPNYWLLNAFERSLVCLTLQNEKYVEAVTCRNAEEFRPPLFPGLAIPLNRLWED